MLFDSGRDREDIGIEDDVLRRKADVVDQDLVGTLANRHFARGGVGLTVFVKGHDHHGNAVAPDQFRLADELALALFEGNRVDDPFALQALEPGFDDGKFRGINHHWDAGNIGLGGEQA